MGCLGKRYTSASIKSQPVIQYRVLFNILNTINLHLFKILNRCAMHYDGTSKLGDALAALYGCSARSHNKIAELIAEAKAGLGMTSKARNLPDAVKLAIYRWHVERLNPV